MNIQRNLLFILLVMVIAITGCAAKSTLVVNHDSVPPGSKVTREGKELALAGTPIMVGQPLPPSLLVASDTMEEVDLSVRRGKILLLSIVPSIDTRVCEEQTHYLGEEGNRLPAGIERITISRDTPFAQQRFAREAKLTHIRFLSDYKEGAFGRSLGLLMEGPRLLARSVLIVDGQGIVRYIQVVPEITNLPDMERAFAVAEQLLDS